MSYRRYLAHSENVLRNYDIYAENRVSKSITCYKAKHMVDEEKHFTIRVEKFPLNSQTIQRFEYLMRAYQQGIISAEEIYLEEFPEYYQCVVIEPLFGANPVYKAETLEKLLKRGALAYAQRQRLFQNIVSTVNCLHILGVPHLNLTPTSILIENGSLIFLKAFFIEPCATADNSWYLSPEETFECRNLTLAADIWAMGCIFCEVFVSLTPLFQSAEVGEKITKIFQCLGIPPFVDVADYMSRNLYDTFTSGIHIDRPYSEQLFANLPVNEYSMLTGMLTFDPAIRPSCKELLESYILGTQNDRPFKPILQDTNNSNSAASISYIDTSSLLAVDRTGNVSADKTPDVSNLLALDTSENIPPLLPQKHHETVKVHESRLASAQRSPAVETMNPPSIRSLPQIEHDNRLIIRLITARNFPLYSHTDKAVFEADVVTTGKAEKVLTDPHKISNKIELNFSDSLRINSAAFSEMYKNRPLVIQVYKVSGNLANSLGFHKEEFGSIEVHMGLLFAGSSEMTSTINGWYNIIPVIYSSESIGQVLIEVKTEFPLREKQTPVAWMNFNTEPKFNTEREMLQAPTLDTQSLTAISEINLNLTQLNDQILNRQPEVQHKEDEDVAFSRAIQDLKKFVLAE